MILPSPLPSMRERTEQMATSDADLFKLERQVLSSGDIVKIRAYMAKYHIVFEGTDAEVIAFAGKQAVWE